MLIVVVAAALALAFVPLWECDACLGIGSLTRAQLIEAHGDSAGLPYAPNGHWECEYCWGLGNINIYRRLTWDFSTRQRLHNPALIDNFREDQLRMYKESWESTP